MRFPNATGPHSIWQPREASKHCSGEQTPQQEHFTPVLLQGVPQLSVPVVVFSQAGSGALQLPLDTQQGWPSFRHRLLQLSVP